MLLRAFCKSGFKNLQRQRLDNISGQPQMYSPWSTGYTSANTVQVAISFFLLPGFAL